MDSVHIRDPLFRVMACRAFADIYYRGHNMRINKYQVKGRVQQAKGTIKVVAGKLVGDTILEAKGHIQKNLGKVQRKLGNIKEHVKESLR